MRFRTLIIAVAIFAATLVAVAVVVIFQMPSGWKLFAFGKPPADRRVAWVEPPGRFEPKGGRIQAAAPADVPGGFVDYANRTLIFRGLVSRATPDWAAPDPGVDFERLRDAGINLITVPVRWQDLEPTPMEVSVDTILGIRTFLDNAATKGIAVILVNTTPFSDAAACPWAPDAPMWAYRVTPRHSTADGIRCVGPNSDDLDAVSMFRTDFLDGRWTPDSLALQDHLVRSWIKLAEVTGRSAGLAGYGIADSMSCPPGMDATACSNAWTGYVDRFANGVRAVHGSALFFLDTDGPDSAAAPVTNVLELVPAGADDSSRGPLNTIPSGSFTVDHHHIQNGSKFLETIDAIERRGRSWLVSYPESGSASLPAATGVLPNAMEMARPRPDAVAGRNMKFSFDRLSLPAGRNDSATEPGTTDVFTLEFDDFAAANAAETHETTVWLPTDTLYRQPSDPDTPGWVLEISDGDADWLPGSRNTILWHTIRDVGTHRMKIVPWGGRRLAPEPARATPAPAKPVPATPAPVPEG